jgi:GAF domain
MNRLEQLEELVNSDKCSMGQVCAELALVFGVGITEIGVLRLEGRDLHFVFPPELQVAGTIPLSGTAIAAHTALGKLPELFNQFAAVPHHNFFESVKLHGAKDSPAPMPIQKMMSVPILNEENETLGVLQVSRKGATPAAAGPDFTSHDLETLERAARRIAYLNPELLSSRQKDSSVPLRFANTNVLKKKA